MLWLAWYFPRLPLEVFEAPDDHPFAVTRESGGRTCIDRCNPAAAAAGIQPGQTLAAARALCPTLAVRPRDRSREAEALEALGGWAWGYSSRITFDPLLVLLEVGGSLRLFGGFEALQAQMADELAALGHAGQWAAAPTPAAAALLARVAPGARVGDRRALRQVVAPVPVRRFTRDEALLKLLTGIGLATIGDCLRLPRPELARRIGPEAARRFDRLLGDAPDPRPAWQPPRRFRRRLDLVAEVETAPALIFPARRLIEALGAFLRGCDGVVQSLDWRLEHRERAATCFTTGLQSPDRDPERLLEVLRQRLELLQLPAPVVSMVLAADHWTPARPHTPDLFATPPAGDPTVIERLRARLGEEAVQGVALVADHRPERSWRPCPPGEGGGRAWTPAQRRQPPWLLPRPQPLDEHNGRPWLGGPLRLEPCCERLQSGWWDEAAAGRDYYRALDPAGRRLWIYRDQASGRWYLHGHFD